MGIGITAGNHAAVFEFFGGILNAQTPSNSLAKRELARECVELRVARPKLVASQFRHGCNRRWELSGLNPAVIRQQMGHSSATMTALYTGEIPLKGGPGSVFQSQKRVIGKNGK